MDRAGPRERPGRAARDLVDQVGEKAKEAVDGQVNSMRASSPRLELAQPRPGSPCSLSLR